MTEPRRSIFSRITWETDLVISRQASAVRRDGARVEAILVADYRVAFDWDGGRWSLKVPAGFRAAPSVPPSLHGVVPFWGALFEASIVHDWCYWTRCFDPLTPAGDGRRAADKLLCALMRGGGATFRDSARVYGAVRIFGGDHYRVNNFKADNFLAPF
jgi:hypothetical protein